MFIKLRLDDKQVIRYGISNKQKVNQFYNILTSTNKNLTLCTYTLS